MNSMVAPEIMELVDATLVAEEIRPVVIVDPEGGGFRARHGSIVKRHSYESIGEQRSAILLMTHMAGASRMSALLCICLESSQN